MVAANQPDKANTADKANTPDASEKPGSYLRVETTDYGDTALIAMQQFIAMPETERMRLVKIFQDMRPPFTLHGNTAENFLKLLLAIGLQTVQAVSEECRAIHEEHKRRESQ